MENLEKVQIFLDGGNFYHLVLKKLNIGEADFDYETFVHMIVNGRQITDMGKRFYKGSVREKEGNEKSKLLMSQQTKFFTDLQKSGWEIKTSKLRSRVEEITIDKRVLEYEQLKTLGIEKITIERMREKGIDVKIATDLIVGALDNKYDTAVLISSDSDLVPAIDWIRNRLNKKIEYIGFSIPIENDLKKSTRPLSLMFRKTDVQRVFSDMEMKKFITKQEQLF